MKRFFDIVVGAIVGLAIAGLILAILLPALVDAGYLGIGSGAAAWTIGSVIAVSVAVMVWRPWRLFARHVQRIK